MTLTPAQLTFLAQARAAAMITLRPDGTPHAVRVGVALVDGHIWSSGLPDRLRTAYVRRDPRTTLFVLGQGFGYLTVEGRVTILDGPEAAEQSLRLFQVMQSGRTDPDRLTWGGKPLAFPEFIAAMRAEKRLIYEIEPTRAYGLVESGR